MPIAIPSAHLPASATDDIAYVEADFVPMAERVRLLADAGGDPEAVAGLFRQRYIAAGGASAAADEEHAAWLTGEYGACLRSTTPEAIVTKQALMRAIAAYDRERFGSPTSRDRLVTGVRERFHGIWA